MYHTEILQEEGHQISTPCTLAVPCFPTTAQQLCFFRVFFFFIIDTFPQKSSSAALHIWQISFSSHTQVFLQQSLDTTTPILCISVRKRSTRLGVLSRSPKPYGPPSLSLRWVFASAELHTRRPLTGKCHLLPTQMLEACQRFLVKPHPTPFSSKAHHSQHPKSVSEIKFFRER